jgi:hypothetical protein
MTPTTDPMALMINNLLTGKGYSVIMYDVNGKKVMDPSQATRLFCKDLYMMVEIGQTMGTSPRPHIMISYSKETPTDLVLEIKQQLSKHNTYDYSFSVKQFDLELQPRHFARNIKVNESGWTGSTRTSRFPVGECWVVIRHQGRLNTEQNPRRWTKINDVFIHHPNGTRYKWDHKHLLGAKAMAQHMHQQGQPWDDHGQTIQILMELVQQLRRVKRWARENNPRICEIAGECQQEIKSLLHKLSNDISYPEAINNTKSLCVTIVNNSNTWPTVDWPQDCDHALSWIHSRIPQEQPVEVLDDTIIQDATRVCKEQQDLNEWFKQFDLHHMFEQEPVTLPDTVAATHSSTQDPTDPRDVYNKIKQMVTGLEQDFEQNPKKVLDQVTQAINLVKNIDR